MADLWNMQKDLPSSSCCREKGRIGMALTLRQLCEQSWYLYEMNIVAGSKGADNIVQWIYALEDVETGDFIRGGELIFTTGIGQRGNPSQWLMTFVEAIHCHEASGLVVNLGPYISHIPQEVIDYCNVHDFPLLEVPWKTRLVDVIRDFCNKIFESEKEEQNLSTVFEHIIFHPNEAKSFAPELVRKGFDAAGDFCLLGVHALFENESVTQQRLFTDRLVRRISHINGKIAHIFREEFLFLILNNFSQSKIDQLVTQIQNLGKDSGFCVQIAVGPNRKNLMELSAGFRKVAGLMRLMKVKDRSPVYYDRLGAQKIILSVDDSQVLIDFMKDTLGALIRYDEENQTNYLALLKRYLDQNGSVQKVAEELFVHRNTVNYQLNKIKKILGCDLDSMEQRFQIMLAFQIREVI